MPLEKSGKAWIGKELESEELPLYVKILVLRVTVEGNWIALSSSLLLGTVEDFFILRRVCYAGETY